VKTVFADTGYWAALLNPKDQLHAKAGEVSSALGKFRILTTEMVLDELLAALSKVPLRLYAIRGVEAIRSNPNVEAVRVGVRQLPQQKRQGVESYRLRFLRPDA